MLAQRTADLAVREAREEATALVEEARIEAGALTAEARDEADRVRAEAEQEVHARIAALESRRVELEHEIEELDRIAATERGRLVASLSAALESVGGMARREDERQGPVDGPDDVAGAATAGETTPGEPTELIDTVVEEQDGPEDETERAGAVPSPPALRSRRATARGAGTEPPSWDSPTSTRGARTLRTRRVPTVHRRTTSTPCARSIRVVMTIQMRRYGRGGRVGLISTRCPATTARPCARSRPTRRAAAVVGRPDGLTGIAASRVPSLL